MVKPEIVLPQSLEEAIQALSRRGALPLAGGTDLIPAMRRGEVKSRLLVNLKCVGRLAGVRPSRGGVRIGALTPVADLLTDPLIRARAPILAEAAAGFGSVQIRNLATVGGNLCNAAPSADLALPLLALEARAEIRGPCGSRTVDLAVFFRGVNKTVLDRSEILVAILLQRPRARTGAALAKVGVRRAMDTTFAGVAAALQLDSDCRTCTRVRIALGAVAPVPMRALRAESILEGERLSQARIGAAAEAAAAACRPVTDLRASQEYRRAMIGTLVRRVLSEAFDRARKEHS